MHYKSSENRIHFVNYKNIDFKLKMYRVLMLIRMHFQAEILFVLCYKYNRSKHYGALLCAKCFKNWSTNEYIIGNYFENHIQVFKARHYFRN